MSQAGSAWTRLKGKIVRPIADAAGDRTAEAKADVEAETGHEPDDATLEKVEDAVRERHGDIKKHNGP